MPEYLISFLAMAIPLAIIVVVLTMVVAASVLIPRLIFLHRRESPTLRALFEQAVAIERLGYQIAAYATEHNKNRAAFFAAIHALPNYAQIRAAPPPATTDEAKQLRFLVLDMQMHIRQTLGALNARPETRIGRAERKYLRNEAARLSAISKPLLLPLYDRFSKDKSCAIFWGGGYKGFRKVD